MNFEYSNEVVKKELTKGISITLLGIIFIAVFVISNFNWKALTAETTASLKYSITLVDYWYVIIGIPLVLFVGGPILASAMLRKTTKYVTDHSGIFVVNQYGVKALIRWKDIVQITETLKTLIIISETNKAVIYKDMESFEKLYGIIIRHTSSKATKNTRKPINDDKEAKKEDISKSAEKTANSEAADKQKNKARKLLEEILAQDASALKTNKSQPDSSGFYTIESVETKEIEQGSQKQKQKETPTQASAQTEIDDKKQERPEEKQKGKLLNAFLSGSQDAEPVKISKATMVMSKSAFKELTKKAIAKRNKANTEHLQQKERITSEKPDSKPSSVKTDRQEPNNPTKTGRLKSRIDTSTLALKGKSSILLSVINKKSQQEEAKAEPVKLSLDTIYASEANEENEKIETNVKKKNELLSKFLNEDENSLNSSQNTSISPNDSIMPSEYSTVITDRDEESIKTEDVQGAADSTKQQISKFKRHAYKTVIIEQSTYSEDAKEHSTTGKAQELNSVLNSTPSGKLPDLSSVLKPTPSGKLPDLSSVLKPTPSGKLPDLSSVLKPTPSGKLPDLSSVLKPTPSGKLPDLSSVLKPTSGRLPDYLRTLKSTNSESVSQAKAFSNDGEALEELKDKPEPKEEQNIITEKSVSQAKAFSNDGEVLEELKDKLEPKEESDFDTISVQRNKTPEISKEQDVVSSSSENLPDLSSVLEPTASGKLPDLSSVLKPTASGKLPDLSSVLKPTPSGKLPDLSSVLKPTPSGKLPDLSSVLKPTPSGKLPDLSSVLKPTSGRLPDYLRTLKSTNSESVSQAKAFSNDGEALEELKDKPEPKEEQNIITEKSVSQAKAFSNDGEVLEELKDKPEPKEEQNIITEKSVSQAKAFSNDGEVLEELKDKLEQKEENDFDTISVQRNKTPEISKEQDVVSSSSENLPDLSSVLEPTASGKLPDLSSVLKPTASGKLPDLSSVLKPTASGKLPDLSSVLKPTASGKLPDLNSVLKPTASGKLPDLNVLLKTLKEKKESQRNLASSNFSDRKREAENADIDKVRETNDDFNPLKTFESHRNIQETNETEEHQKLTQGSLANSTESLPSQETETTRPSEISISNIQQHSAPRLDELFNNLMEKTGRLPKLPHNIKSKLKSKIMDNITDTPRKEDE